MRTMILAPRSRASSRVDVGIGGQSLFVVGAGRLCPYFGIGPPMSPASAVATVARNVAAVRMAEMVRIRARWKRMSGCSFRPGPWREDAPPW